MKKVYYIECREFGNTTGIEIGTHTEDINKANEKFENAVKSGKYEVVYMIVSDTDNFLGDSFTEGHGVIREYKA